MVKSEISLSKINLFLSQGDNIGMLLILMDNDGSGLSHESFFLLILISWKHLYFLSHT